MTTKTDIVNLALQWLGTRTTVTDAQLAGNLNNESKQANLIFDRTRDEVLRRAPWNCGQKTANLVYITSVPGTPENTSPATTLWQPGQPPPPWAYEYQYPVDCLRPCWIIPATQTGFAGAVPITTAVTGGAPSFWQGGPVTYKVQTDLFVPVTGATPSAPGSGYAVGDLVTLASGAQGSPPIGAPVVLSVATIGGGGAITSVNVVPQVFGSSPAAGGSYFAQQANPVAQGSTTGAGTGATFNLTYSAASPQRVIVTNQEFAILSYVQRVLDPNVMDEQFLTCWSAYLGARLCMALTGDKALANLAIGEANTKLIEARAGDGNEGLTINDVTPDWIRFRGIWWTEAYSGPYSLGDFWGPTWSFF